MDIWNRIIKINTQDSRDSWRTCYHGLYGEVIKEDFRYEEDGTAYPIYVVSLEGNRKVYFPMAKTIWIYTFEIGDLGTMEGYKDQYE